ncbi:MAG: response regulator [Aestuariibaculum sp.]
MKPKIILADGHPLLLEGAIQHLKSLNKYDIVGKANNGYDAYRLIMQEQPELAILDIKMPALTGLEIAKMVKENKLKTKIIILASHKEEHIFEEIGKTIHAYLSKNVDLSDLSGCVEHILNGTQYITPKIKKQDLNNNFKQLLKILTPTEIKILQLIGENETSQNIANALFISVRTVEKHRSNMLKKLNLDSSHNALFVWFQQNKNKFQ